LPPVSRYNEDGFLVLKGALSPSDVAALPFMASGLAALGESLAASKKASKAAAFAPAAAEAAADADAAGILVHHELAAGPSGGADERRLCRVENFCSASLPGKPSLLCAKDPC
jgi:hypothetical protein